MCHRSAVLAQSLYWPVAYPKGSCFRPYCGLPRTISRHSQGSLFDRSIWSLWSLGSTLTSCSVVVLCCGIASLGCLENTAQALYKWLGQLSANRSKYSWPRVHSDSGQVARTATIWETVPTGLKGRVMSCRHTQEKHGTLSWCVL